MRADYGSVYASMVWRTSDKRQVMLSWIYDTAAGAPGLDCWFALRSTSCRYSMYVPKQRPAKACCNEYTTQQQVRRRCLGVLRAQAVHAWHDANAHCNVHAQPLASHSSM
jgi:hypothetical protein